MSAVSLSSCLGVQTAQAQIVVGDLGLQVSRTDSRSAALAWAWPAATRLAHPAHRSTS